MALPKILPYPMPGETDLPKNKVAWTADPNRAVLLIHDMQQYFIDAFTPDQSPVVELIAHIQKLRSCCAELGIPVIYSAQPGVRHRSSAACCRISGDPASTTVHTRKSSWMR